MSKQDKKFEEVFNKIPVPPEWESWENIERRRYLQAIRASRKAVLSHTQAVMREERQRVLKQALLEFDAYILQTHDKIVPPIPMVEMERKILQSLSQDKNE